MPSIPPVKIPQKEIPKTHCFWCTAFKVGACTYGSNLQNCATLMRQLKREAKHKPVIIIL